MAENGRELSSGHPRKAHDLLGGASLGLFLGILIGLSTTAVVSIVITALVALLAAFFGLSDKSRLSTSSSGARRLIAFGVSATIFTLVGIWLRTHETLAPSVDEQKQVLRSIGYADKSKEQTEMLRYLRYGLLPAGATVGKQSQASFGVLYSNVAPGTCADLLRTASFDDFVKILSDGDEQLKRVAGKLRELAPEKRSVGLETAKLTLCPEG
jgi:hypothetical protein